jgi:hypothetical protein
MTDHTPLTNDQTEELRARLNSPDTTTEGLREIAQQLLADRGYWYMDADYWRESYRLVKGLSDDEIGAMTAARDASKVHPRPCWFPHEACVCDEESETEEEHEECLGIHRSSDGYQDCDGKPI